MVLGWTSMRKSALQRPLFAVLVLSILTVSLRAIFQSHSFRSLVVIRLNDVDIRVDLTVGSDRKGTGSSEEEAGRPRLGNHTITPDGLLIVNPDGPHPIFQLIRDAEAAWNTKRARASKTLDEAVAEYRRRYRRAPPLGFDKWWDYAVRHHVQQPDEYDEIFNDIEPFWGIDPRELQRTQQEIELQDSMVTSQKTDALPRIEVVRSNVPLDNEIKLLDRIHEILAVVHEVAHDLPPLRITFTPHDNPGMLSDWRIKSMALEAAANRTTLTRADFPPVRERGWIQACPPDSPARLHSTALPPSPSPYLPPSSPKTFIASHRDTMDPCMHPSLLTTHGQFIAFKTGPFPQHTLVPLFSLCATLLHHDVRPPVPYGWDFELDPELDEDGVDEEEEDDDDGAFEGDVPWEQKTNSRLDWRGRTTGVHASKTTSWLNGQRQRLVTLMNALEGNVSVLRVPANGSESGTVAETIPVGEPERMPLARVNPAWMDVAFTGEPIGCDRKDGTCEEMTRMWAFQEVQKRNEEGQYKFILDVDGNGWSGRFKRLISSNALVFKSTIYPEWYTSRIMPWVHYVPIQVSYADLYDAVSFFRVHDELGRRIARAGRAWSRRYWRRVDMTAYLYRLLLEYARVTSLDRAAMDYVG